MHRKLLLLFFLNLWGGLLVAQQPRCQFSLKKGEKYIHRFGQRIANHLKQRRGTQEEMQWEIPVVFHIVHNGEPVGEGSNILAAQIYSQLAVLNEDFNRQNADTLLTNSIFKPVAAAVGITFKPALISPEGQLLTEPGIHRYQSKRQGFNSDNADAELKVHTQWNPAEYLNVWVVPAIGGFLGSAQFPALTGLEGLDDELDTENTEGVIVAYTALGRTPNNPFISEYNLGRTLTHEIGHWLGLFHPWGPDQGGCFRDDFCEDTPNVNLPFFGCPDAPLSGCNGVRMHENFMEYTDDACMNLFTQDQKNRILATMELGRFRSVLQQSAAAPDTAVLANVDAQKWRACVGETILFTALAKTINLEQEETQFFWKFEGAEIVEANGNEVQVSFEEAGAFDVQLIATNATYTDTVNFRRFLQIVDNSALPTTAFTDFEEEIFPPEDWQVNGIGWQQSTIGKQSSSSVVALNYYQNLVGQVGQVISPRVLVPDTRYLEVSFEVAYTTWRGSNAQDTLALYYRSECDTRLHLVWQAAGEALATVAPRQNELRPFQNNNWKTVTLPVEIPQGNAVEFVWETRSGFGNNLYLDNLAIQPFRGVLGDFTQNTQWICEGDTVQFTDTSLSFSEDTLQQRWFFEGGNPSTSTEKSPKVTYATAGNYSVRLISTRADGVTQEINRRNEVRVIENQPIDKIEEDFEQQAFIDWNVIEGEVSIENVGAYAESDRGLLLHENTSFYSTPIDIGTTHWISLTWDFASQEVTENDSLVVSYSTDCRQSFQSWWSGAGESLKTYTAALETLPNFLDWKTNQITLPVSNLGNSLFVKVDYYTSEGANLYLDNLTLKPKKGFMTTVQAENIRGGVCVDNSVQFSTTTKVLENGEIPTTFQWTFNGGNPQTSNLASPMVQYSSEGTFDVMLVVSSANHTDTLFLEDYISVVSPVLVEEQFTETFEQATTFFDRGWVVSPTQGWEIASAAGGFGQSFRSISAKNNQFNRKATTQLISPPFNLLGNTSAEIQFDIAYGTSSIDMPTDTLNVRWSSNCGQSFSTLATLTETDLITSSRQVSSFIPRPDEWKTVKLSLDEINASQENTNIKIAFENRSAQNNALYIDNFTVTPFTFEPPEVDFTHSLVGKDTLFILEDTVQLLDLSSQRARTWLWEIEGPRDYQLTEQNPVIVFDFPGIYNVQLTVSNPAGEATLRKQGFITVESRLPVSLSPKATEPSLIIYPNPARYSFRIEGLQEKTNVSLYRLTGELLMTKRLSPQNNLVETTHLAASLYLLKIGIHNRIVWRRIIIGK